jgi:hypothetical protein
MTIVIQNKIRKAACFDDIVQAFGEHFGFNVESWKHQADEGRAILEKIDYARSLSNPIDKAIAGASMSENLPSDKALRFAGLDPGTYKANVAEIFPLAENGKPETSLGKVTYEQYFKDGVLSPDVKNIAQKHFKISSQIEDLRKRVAEKTAEINKRTQEKVDEYYYKSDLSEAKDNIVRVNRKISELGKKLQRKINNGAISIEEADRENTKFNKIYKDQAKKDWETLNRIQGEVAEIYKRSVIEVNNACGNLNNDIEKLTTESLKPATQEFYEKTVCFILDSSPISKEKATIWAGSQSITDSAKRRLKKQGYPVEQLKEDMAEFYRLCGGRVETLDILTDRKRRAHADVYEKKVYLDSDFNKTALFHEMAHLLESNEHIRRASNHFRDKRTQGKSLKSLRTLTGNKGYKRNENAFEDGFIDPYVGKYYSSGMTEVCSMGFQQFATPDKAMVFYQKDPEMFQFIFGMMNSPITDLEKRRIDAAGKAGKDGDK